MKQIIEWIKIQDELLPIKEYVLILFRDDVDGIVLQYAAFYPDEDGCEYCDSIPKKSVIAWARIEVPQEFK